jgi:putative tryptophan/tyrosine transport system substrate-binding protein
MWKLLACRVWARSASDCVNLARPFWEGRHETSRVHRGTWRSGSVAGGGAAQQPAMPVVGCLVNGSATGSDDAIVPFRQGLQDTGYVEGRNLVIEYRWADGHNDRLPALAAELISLRVAVIAAISGASGALAAKRLTTTIPIVFLTAGDAVEFGLITNLSKPEGNLTGVSGVTSSLVTKQLGLLGN